MTLSWSKMSSISYFSGGSQPQFSLVSSAQHHQFHTSASPVLSGIRSVRSIHPLFLMVSPRLESSLRRSPFIPPPVQRQASASDVCKSDVRGDPQLTRVLDLECCRLSRLCSPYVSSITTVAGLPTPLAPPSSSTPPCRLNSASSLLCRHSSQFIGFFDRGRLSLFVHEMGHYQFAVGLTSPIRLQGPHLLLAVSQLTLMWGGLVSLTNLLKMFSGFTGLFTETNLHSKHHLSCSKSSLSFHLPVDSLGPSLSPFASFLRSNFPPTLWRCLSISITILLSCGAVCSGPEDAAEFVSMSFRGADWMSTSHVTIFLLSDHVVKAILTHSSIVLSSLSSSSFEDLSFLFYAVVVYVFNQRGWTIPSIICNQAS
ncbi:hypothetical protein Bca52824_001362 [Brassica carinata]|uniref:Uncharacterized protein n=1 Tax=Brassica carinata TaxID=52824 RepID=A0A8X7WIY0_BRACI|nr:hypothetical protein Bca52824_001362 [Brassica carinata]